MSKTFRVDPKTFEEEVERRFLKRHKKEKVKNHQRNKNDDCDENLDYPEEGMAYDD